MGGSRLSVNLKVHRIIVSSMNTCLCALSPVLSLLNSMSEYLLQVHIDLLEGHGLISALRCVQSHTSGDAKCVTEIVGGQKIRKLGDNG